MGSRNLLQAAATVHVCQLQVHARHTSCASCVVYANTNCGSGGCVACQWLKDVHAWWWCCCCRYPIIDVRGRGLMVGVEFGGTDSSDRLKPEKGVAMVSEGACVRFSIMLESLSHTLVVAYSCSYPASHQCGLLTAPTALHSYGCSLLHQVRGLPTPAA